jgi:hypothetical protein
MKALVDIEKPVLAVIQNGSGEIEHVLCTFTATFDKKQIMYLLIEEKLMSDDDVSRMVYDGFGLDERIESWLEANSYEFRMIEEQEIVAR